MGKIESMHQKGIDIEGKVREDSAGKLNLLEILTDKLVGNLNLPENYKIIDELMGEEGASQELADKLLNYSEELGSKKIEIESNARDVLGNLFCALFLKIDRVKRKGLNEERKKDIVDDFTALKDYSNLLINNKDFEKMELGSKHGFLGSKMGEKESEAFKSNKNIYMEKCGKFLGLQKKERINKE